MFFAKLMNQRKIYFYGSLCIALLSAVILLTSQNKNEVFTALVKIAMRDLGNQLLLSNQDSTSLILPVQKMDESRFQLSFQKEIAINPDSLVAFAHKSFEKANLSSHYQIEVKQCTDFEVAYSFLKNANVEKSIIPCSGRIIPQKCYNVEVLFLDKTVTTSNKLPWIILLFLSIVSASVFFFKKKTAKATELSNENSIRLGKFQFHPEESKLVREAQEINLSKKEVELLTLFAANPNKIIKREELSKRVWEDHGVFVGRSLDTYISKLRKKLNDDENIKLTNVHGIGYILEIKEL